MLDDEHTVNRSGFLRLRPVVWRLLLMHWVIVNHELSQTDRPPLSIWEVVSNLYSAFVIDHAREIQTRFWDIVAESQKQGLSGILSLENLERLTGASAADLPDLLSTLRTRSDAIRKRESRKRQALRKSLGRTLDLVQRLTRRSQKVRGGSGGTTAATHHGT